MVAGLLQIVASVALGMARTERFAQAAAERPGIYLLVAALLTAAVFTVWLVRDRPALALTLALAWPLGLWAGLRGRATGLGLAFHGEFVVHHFSALLCLAIAVSLPIAWARDQRLGPLRFAPALLAIPGAVLLAGAHVAPMEVGPAVFARPWVPTVGAGLLLATWPVSAAVFWTRMGPGLRRPIVWILMLPVVLRLVFAGVSGLSGELIEPERIPWLGAGVVVTAIATLLLLRPRVDRWLMAVIGAICLLGSMFFYYFYEHGFGELEDGLGGLLQSLFGFQVPYPPYADDLRSAALMMGLFFIFVTVYASLVSAEDRSRGIALGLMMIAGLGLSSPHLALMLGAGAMLFVETLLPGAPHRELVPRSPFARQVIAELDSADDSDGDEPQPGSASADVRAVLGNLADRLGSQAPATVETDAGWMLDLRDELDGRPFDLRARVEASATRIELIIGLPGRGDPIFELVPDVGDRGQRPAHLLARSHRVVGATRSLEALGDPPLDALTRFPTAYLRAWEAGLQVDLGRDLDGVSVDALEALVRSLTRVV